MKWIKWLEMANHPMGYPQLSWSVFSRFFQFLIHLWTARLCLVRVYSPSLQLVVIIPWSFYKNMYYEHTIGRIFACCFSSSQYILVQHCGSKLCPLQWLHGVRATVCKHWIGHWEDQTTDFFILVPLCGGRRPSLSLHPSVCQFLNWVEVYWKPKFICEVCSGLHSVLSLCVLSENTSYPPPADSAVASCVWASLLAAPGPKRND